MSASEMSNLALSLFLSVTTGLYGDSLASLAPVGTNIKSSEAVLGSTEPPAWLVSMPASVLGTRSIPGIVYPFKRLPANVPASSEPSSSARKYVPFPGMARDIRKGPSHRNANLLECDFSLFVLYSKTSRPGSKPLVRSTYELLNPSLPFSLILQWYSTASLRSSSLRSSC